MADNGYFCVLILVLGAGNKSVKITLILPILNDTVFLKFALGKGFCNGRCHFSFIRTQPFGCFALMPFYDIVSFTAATTITGIPASLSATLHSF